MKQIIFPAIEAGIKVALGIATSGLTFLFLGVGIWVVAGRFPTVAFKGVAGMALFGLIMGLAAMSIRLIVELIKKIFSMLTEKLVG